MNKNLQKGFTLVELSIVLVIIGLLTGGILVAQSMIETARLQRVVRDIQQMDVAVTNFGSKFNSLPGDSKAISGGNGDGIIDSMNCTAGWENIPEVANFWSDLSITGFKPNNQTFTTAIADPTKGLNFDPTNPNVFALSFSNTAQVLVLGDSCTIPYGAVTSPTNASGLNAAQAYYFITNKIPSRNVGYNGTSAVFTPLQARAIDIKMDDGKPLTGTVHGSKDDGIWFRHCVVNAGSSTTDYDISRSTKECEMSVNLQKNF